MRAGSGQYPEIEPYQTHRIKVDAPHDLYVEESGTRDGIPALFLHGGPGSSAKAGARRSFDPNRFRIVLFDQRGCGKSTPSADLTDNDTDALIRDIETIRETLGIEKWLVTGGSWGSFLSLAYAIAHPDRCLGLRLSGVFTGTKAESRHWFHGIGDLFPEAFDTFAGYIPEEERDDLQRAYYKRLVDPDPDVHLPAAAQLRGYSALTQTLVPNPDHIATLTEPKAALEVSRLFTHYGVNGFFRPEGYLLENVDKIRHLPCEIVQGRYDVVCLPKVAWALAKAWPEARFTMVALANHVANPSIPDLNDALANATDRLADQIAPELPSLDAYYDAAADTAPAISADGTLMAWISDATGLQQLWTRALPDGEPQHRLQTGENVTGLAFRPGSRDILFTTDFGGDERHQFFLLPDGASTPQPLVNDPGVPHNWGCFDATGARIAWTDCSRDATCMDVWMMDLASGEKTCLLETTGWTNARAFSPDGTQLLVEDDVEGAHHAGLLLIDIASGAVTTLLERAKGQFGPIRWSKDGATLFMATNRGSEFNEIKALDLATGTLSSVMQPTGEVEQLALAPDGTTAYAAVNVDGNSWLMVADLPSRSESALALPHAGRITALVNGPGAAVTICLHRFTAPPAIYTLPLDGTPAAPLVKRADPMGTVEPSEVLIDTPDGVQVPAFRFEPSAPRADRPALIWVHGGPESQFAANWRAWLPYMVNRGWTVVAPNVRGSTGYGRTWQDADDRENRMVPVRDLKAVRDWLGTQDGIGKVAVGGESYGGFMTLAALTEYPDDWAAGCDVYGIYDFVTLLETTAHYRRVLRGAEYGHATDPADFDFLRRFSPSRKVDRITAPVFITHGDEDPRVPPSESEMLATVLKSRGHPCEMVRIPHEGHGYKRRADAKRAYGAMTAFLIRTMGTGL